jgi:uncharacterized protein YndB with AHSA1/START domain
MRGIVSRVILGLVVLAVVAMITYGLASPWISTWGATQEEAARSLPGDGLVPEPAAQSTMAVTIDAPPEEVWGWLVQMGVDRAGFYTYLFVENTLLRLGVVEADRIHSEWQDIEVGDHFWYTTENYPGPRQGPVVTDIAPERALVLCLGEPIRDCPGTWQFVFEEEDDGSTRLLLRSRDRSLSVGDQILGPGFWVMNRGMLLGLEQKAEGEPSARSLAEWISFACVIVAGLGLVAMLISRRRWPQTLLVASAGACLTTLVFFLGYPSVVLGILLVLAVIGVLIWTYWPQRSRPAARRRVA